MHRGRQTKVSKLDPLLAKHQDILRLQIAMGHTMPVAVLKCIDYLQKDSSYRVIAPNNAAGRIGNGLEKVTVGRILEHYKGKSRFLDDIENTQHIGVVADFGVKSYFVDVLIFVQKNLNSVRFVCRNMLPKIDDTIAAFAENPRQTY